ARTGRPRGAALRHRAHGARGVGAPRAGGGSGDAPRVAHPLVERRRPRGHCSVTESRKRPWESKSSAVAWRNPATTTNTGTPARTSTSVTKVVAWSRGGSP